MEWSRGSVVPCQPTPLLLGTMVAQCTGLSQKALIGGADDQIDYHAGQFVYIRTQAGPGMAVLWCSIIMLDSTIN